MQQSDHPASAVFYARHAASTPQSSYYSWQNPPEAAPPSQRTSLSNLSYSASIIAPTCSSRASSSRCCPPWCWCGSWEDCRQRGWCREARLCLCRCIDSSAPEHLLENPCETFGCFRGMIKGTCLQLSPQCHAPSLGSPSLAFVSSNPPQIPRLLEILGRTHSWNARMTIRASLTNYCGCLCSRPWPCQWIAWIPPRNWITVSQFAFCWILLSFLCVSGCRRKILFPSSIEFLENLK